jgi:hypothetical protein
MASSSGAQKTVAVAAPSNRAVVPQVPGLVAVAAEDTGKALILRAAAFRRQFRVSAEPVRLPPFSVGFHPQNRGGQPPNPLTVLNLAKAILKTGFCDQEADCNGVCVQAKPGDLKIHTFNIKNCDGSLMMAATLNGQTISHGSLSHSHLHQVLKNFAAALKLPLSDIIDKDGRVNLQLLEKHDEVFAKYCKLGLLWDVMHHDINDHVEVMDTIQAALNSKNALALVPSEMEALSRMGDLCAKEFAKAGAVAFESVRDMMSATMPSIADDVDFRHLFCFVIEVGGNSAPFLPDLLRFTSKFVDPKVWISLIC